MKMKVIIICITLIFAIVFVILLISKESSQDRMETQVIQDFSKYRDDFEIICKNVNAKEFKEIYKKNYVEYSSNDQDKKAYECIFKKLNYTSIAKSDESIVFRKRKGKYNLNLIYSKNPDDHIKYYQVLDENWYYIIFMKE